MNSNSVPFLYLSSLFSLGSVIFYLLFLIIYAYVIYIFIHLCTYVHAYTHSPIQYAESEVTTLKEMRSSLLINFTDQRSMATPASV